MDVVNGAEVEPIPFELLTTESNEVDDERSCFANVKIKTLTKKFKKRINTFEISYFDGEERVGEEVVLQIEM